MYKSTKRPLIIGVVIQGPIRSSGRSGEFFSNPDAELVEHDCIPDILDNYFNSKAIFKEVIISTWSNEDIDHLIGKVEPRDLIVNSLTGVRNSNLDSSFKNRDFQSISTARGLEELRRRGCSHALKVRTDMHFTPNALRQLELNVQSIERQTILIPFKDPSHKSFILDFYFAGKIKDLLLMLTSTQGRNMIIESIHDDLFYSKIFYSYINPVLTLIPRKLLMSVTRRIRRLWKLYEKYVYENHLKPLPKNVLTSSLWRGSSLDRGPLIQGKIFQD